MEFDHVFKTEKEFVDYCENHPTDFCDVVPTEFPVACLEMVDGSESQYWTFWYRSDISRVFYDQMGTDKAVKSGKNLTQKTRKIHDAYYARNCMTIKEFKEQSRKAVR